MIEAVMLWNEPNNLAHWDFRLDPKWHIFADMIKTAAAAIRAENSVLRIVLGGISPIDPGFLAHLKALGVLDCIDVIGVHGFPLDWNHWNIHAWPEKLAEVRQVTDRPIWVTEVGVSTFGADELQEMGLQITASLLANRVERIYWYSLFDLPQAWFAVAHYAQPQDSEYSRHFHMGLIRQDGTPKPALRRFAKLTPTLGICQWFHFQDPRLDAAVSWLRQLGVTRLRTGLSWADSLRPQAELWYDRQMQRLEAFHICLTFCFTPASRGMVAHHTSPPQNVDEFAAFCATMIRRYAA
jgi:beta-xylosidase